MFIDLSFLLILFIFFNFLVKTNLTKNSVLVALYIVGAFIVSGIIFLLVDMSLLGVMLIIVYVGAVVVLFLFVTMIMPLRVNVSSYYTFSLFLVYSLWYLCLISFFSIDTLSVNFLNFFSFKHNLLVLLGSLLYIQKTWYFLIAAFLLTISMVGAISLTQTRVPVDSMKEVINVQLNKNFVSDLYLYK